MLIKDSSNPGVCDICNGQSFKLKLAAVAQGATGRFCEVMWLCDEHDKENEALDVDCAREICDNASNGWADF